MLTTLNNQEFKRIYTAVVSRLACLPIHTRGGHLALDHSAEGREGLLRLLAGGHGSSPGSTEAAGGKRLQIVDWDGYQRIDREEVARGTLKGKPREKLVDVERMLEVAGAGKTS